MDILAVTIYKSPIAYRWSELLTFNFALQESSGSFDQSQKMDHFNAQSNKTRQNHPISHETTYHQITWFVAT